MAKKKKATKKVVKKKVVRQMTFLDLNIEEIDAAAQGVFDAQLAVKQWKSELALANEKLNEARRNHSKDIGRGRYLTEVSDGAGGLHRFEVVKKDAREESTVLKKIPKAKDD